jgi:hypothetical protein
LGVKTVRASQDYKIKAHECKLVRVDGDFRDDGEWLVDRNLLANAEGSFFSVPNTLISARKPVLPVSNMSDRPRFVRKGEILGTLKNPQEYFDSPSSLQEVENLKEKSTLLAKIIKARSENDEAQANGRERNDGMEERRKTERKDGSTRVRTDFGSGVPPQEENEWNGVHVRDIAGRVPDPDGSLPNNSDEEEEYGPKTAAMPDSTVYPSARMEELLDVGSLPEDLKRKAWEMLKRRVKAFAFDGRLGHVNVRAPIRVKEGVDPIAVPMYGSSPEKRRVIDVQLEKWFEQGVIEPSVSPWSAPVVIAYRN